MPPFSPVYVVNAWEMPASAVVRSQLSGVIVGGPTTWASSPATVPGWSNTRAVPIGAGTPVSAASVGWPDASTADRQACAQAVVTSVAAVISGASPSTGPAAGGTVVRITGTRFAGSTGVSFGGVAAAFTVVSDGLIEAITRAGTAGGKDIVVTNLNGNGTLAAGWTYT
jgi:hypothetical protein